MQERSRPTALPLCPSAQPDWAGSVALGIVGGTPVARRVGYLARPLPVTDELLALSGSVQPTEVLRFAAPCAGDRCRHFDGASCQLVAKVVQWLPVVVDRLPPCPLRPQCRWWQQEGPAACRRCPQIITEDARPSPALQQAADPSVAAWPAPPTAATPAHGGDELCSR